MPCSTCGTLPDRLVANTGRDDYLPPEAGRLLRDELDPTGIYLKGAA